MRIYFTEKLTGNFTLGKELDFEMKKNITGKAASRDDISFGLYLHLSYKDREFSAEVAEKNKPFKEPTRTVEAMCFQHNFCEALSERL